MRTRGLYAVPQLRRSPCLVCGQCSSCPSHPWAMSRLHMRGMDLVISFMLPCLWPAGQVNDLSDLDERHAIGGFQRIVEVGRVEGHLWMRRGFPYVRPQMVSRSRFCEYPAQQRRLGATYCLAVGQPMLPSVKMSRSLMTRPVAAPGIYEIGLSIDWPCRASFPWQRKSQDQDTLLLQGIIRGQEH